MSLQYVDQHRVVACGEPDPSLKSQSALVHLGRGDALRRAKRFDDAIEQYRQASAVDPGLAEAQLNLGGVLHVTGRRDEAIRCYLRALAINARLGEAHYNLGNLYAEIENVDAAIFHYERAIELIPTWAEPHNNLANMLQRRSRYEDAIGHYQEALRLKPQYASARRNLASAFKALNRFEEAIGQYRAALISEPDDPTTYNLLASAMLVAGHLDEATKAYEAALELAPEDPGIYLNYAAIRRFSPDDPYLARLERLVVREAQMPDRDRIALHFALGKAFADLSQAERSFRHLEIGNRLKRKYVAYDERGTLASFDRIREVFSADMVQAKSGRGHDCAVPVFIIGMPRSGTSLVEQILASHPRVFGAGEVDHFAAVASEIGARATRSYPEMLSVMSTGDLRDLGRIYCERLARPAPNADRIVDKMPSNFMLAGLIHLALPHARIIHVRRDPADTCVSCFSLLFAEDQPFAYDLAELGRYYRAYDALMAHWHAVLPEGSILDVQYEDVVKDLEGQSRRIVEYCGLEWDPRCVAYHETRRPVKTASVVQVRAPINSRSIGRSGLYGARLRPLLDELGLDSKPFEVVGPARTVEVALSNRAIPDDPERIADFRIERAVQLAAELQKTGQVDQVERLLSAVLGLRPQHVVSLSMLGSLCASTNRPVEARAYFERMIAAVPNSGEAYASLAAVYASQGRADAALACYTKALSLAPNHPGIHYGLAAALQSLGRNEEGVRHLKAALAVRPEHLESHFLMGNLLYAAGKDQDAARCYLKVLQLNPRHPEAHNNLGNVLLRQGEAERAIGYYRTAIEINPAYADAYGNLGNALLELDRLEESIEQNRRALELKPDRFGSYNNLGVALQALGRFDEAREAFERALERSPDEAPVHLNLANMGRFKPRDRRLPGLRRLMSVVDSLDADKQISAHFAMGKALSDLRQYDEAFAHYKTANALKRRTFDYDEVKRLAMFENIRTAFPPELFKANGSVDDKSWSPIFIVGMPRSGTTLMEQVLASHSKVFGAGELETFKELIGECAAREGVPPAYPDLMKALSPDAIAQIGQLYTSRVRSMAPDAKFIVDKMPLNFVFVGLIHLALPQARFIHTRRDPLDTCMSCFSLLFTGSQPFAYELGELGRYYRGYEAVMDHWHHVLPEGVLMDVQYEDLVEDIESVSRSVLKHCGLDWEDACLNFHDNRRMVRTASLMQVRKPLYKSAIGGWRRYAQHLLPLAEALGQDVPARVAAEIDPSAGRRKVSARRR